MEKIETLAKKIIEKSGIDIPLIMELEQEKKYASFGAYHYEKKSIILREKPLLREFKEQVKKGVFNDFESFIEVVIFHEIGHAQDKELPMIQKEKTSLLKNMKSIKTEKELDDLIIKMVQMILRAEKNAWEFAEKRIREEYQMSLKKYKKLNIQSYINEFLFLREQALKRLIS